MLHALRRLLKRPVRPTELGAVEQWADQLGATLRRERHGAGCIVEGRLGTQLWRLEFGPPQRSYVKGLELRLIAELELPGEFVAVVLNRRLLDEMERLVYEQYIDDVQTRADTAAPPEMRWLVLYPRLEPKYLGELRGRYGAAGSVLQWLQQWVGSSFGQALAETLPHVPPEHPVVLTIQRGRVTLRTALAQPDEVSLTRWFRVFSQALREARQLRDDWRDANVGATTLPSAWGPGLGDGGAR